MNQLSEKPESVNEKTKSFMAHKKILIIDSSSSVRAQLVKLVMELGATRSYVSTTKSYDEAERLIRDNKVQILISEFEVEKRPLLTLSEKIIEENSENERLVMLVTQNGNQSSVAQALEGQVDGYIIKPFVYGFIKESFEKTIMRKLYPSKNQKLLREAKEHIEKKSFYLAEPILVELIKNQKSPTMALYYYGQLFLERGDADKAIQFWQKALDVQDLHFKSLTAIYELAWEQKDFDTALKYLSKLKTVLPLTPKRLGQLFQLYMFNGDHMKVIESMADYYELDEKSAELSSTVSASLLAAGKFFVKEDRIDLSHDAFMKFLAIENYELTGLSKVIHFLIDHSQIKIAEFFLAKSRIEDRASLEFMALEFRINAYVHGNGYVITRGRELIKAGSEDADVHKLYIEANFHEDRPTVAEQALMNAKTMLPDRMEVWSEIETSFINKGDELSEPTKESLNLAS